MISLAEVRERLERRAAGQLSEAEQASLARDARTLRRRLERVQALYPDLGVELSAELDELAQPPVLTASG